MYEKFFVINQIDDDSAVTNYQGSASDDFYGAPMRGLPWPSSVTIFSYCVPPGDYTVHAVDTAGNGWWGGSFYSVIIDGANVMQEEMGRASSTRQSTTFTVALSQSGVTAFAENTALHGGGAAIFWQERQPANVERYRNESTSNVALYGDYVATPARELVATNYSFQTVSGVGMVTNPITIQLRDW